MPASSTPTHTHTPEQVAMLKEFRTLVAEYPSKSTGGTKAPITRKLNKLTVRMSLSRLLGVDTVDQVEAGEGDFVYFAPVQPSADKTYNTTPEELVALIASLRAMAADDSTDSAGRPYPAIVRATAEKELATQLDNAKARGIEVPAA